ncbi:hypothetical protein Hanom_Chr02g00141861 [Helianthus anomalus]
MYVGAASQNNVLRAQLTELTERLLAFMAVVLEEDRRQKTKVMFRERECVQSFEVF